MPSSEVEPRRTSIAFGAFEADFAARELRKQGTRIRIQEQPLQLLEVLLERPGEIVSREEIQGRIWPADTFVDFDKGLYNAVKKLREALGDTAATPVFIETVPKRGYRFVAPVSRPEPMVGIADHPHRQAPQLYKLARKPWSLLARLALAASVFVLLLLSGHAPSAPLVSAALAPPQGMISVDENRLQHLVMAYYRGVDGNLYQLVWPWSPTRWSQVTGFGGRPSVVQGSGLVSHVNTATGQPEVFYIATSGHVMQISLAELATEDLSLPGAPPAAEGSELAGVMDECNQTEHLFYIGVDRHVHGLMWSKGAGWSTHDLTRSWQGGPAMGSHLVALAGGGSTQVFYFQQDHHVHEIWAWSGCPEDAPFDGWHSSDVNVASGSAPEAAGGSGLAASIYLPQKKRSIFYEDQSHHLQALIFSVDGLWKNIDVTSAAGAPGPGTDGLSSQVDPGTGQVFAYYIDRNRDVRLVASDPSAPERWTEPRHSPINKLVNQCEGSREPAPAAANGSPLASSPHFYAQDGKMDSGDVYYLGSDRELYWLGLNSNSVVCADISKITKSPEPLP